MPQNAVHRDWMDMKECWSSLLPHSAYWLRSADKRLVQQINIQIEKYETAESQVLQYRPDKYAFVLTVRITTAAAA